MKKSFLYVFAISAIGFLLSTASFAQNNRTVSAKDLYVISAKAGGVNYVEGKVFVAQKNKRNGLLLKGDKLEVGETVTTDANGKTEILLNPGSYIRLAGNSAFEFLDTSLDNLQIKLNRGSAMFEVITDSEFQITVNTPKANFYIIKSGIYRVDVLPDGTGKLEVWKGKAQIGDSQTAEVKGGREATVNGNQVAVAKFDRDEKDALETWSKTRAKELAKLNSRLQQRDLRNTLMSSYSRNGWSIYDSFGLWVYDRFSASYCFLPFGYGWSSPYGYGYGRDIWYYNLPRFVYYTQPMPSGNGTIVAGNSGRVQGVITEETRERRRISPPFERIQKSIGREPIQNDSSPIYAPVIVPSREAPPIIISSPSRKP